MKFYRELVGKGPEPRSQLVAKEELDQLFGALLLLLDDERTVIVLKHLHNWTIADIADHIERSPTAVCGLLNRGLAKLRHRLRPMGS